jgi:hypothetical protein
LLATRMPRRNASRDPALPEFTPACGTARPSCLNPPYSRTNVKARVLTNERAPLPCNSDSRQRPEQRYPTTAADEVRYHQHPSFSPCQLLRHGKWAERRERRADSV